MSTSTDTERLTPATRLARGFKYTVAGPLHLVLGALGIALGVLRSAAGVSFRLVRTAKSAGEEIALAEVAAPVAVARRARPLLLVGGIVALLAVGGATFSIVRRSMQPEPSVLPPSVDVTPQP